MEGIEEGDFGSRNCGSGFLFPTHLCYSLLHFA
jgi:hypothetical protein